MITMTRIPVTAPKTPEGTPAVASEDWKKSKNSEAKTILIYSQN